MGQANAQNIESSLRELNDTLNKDEGIVNTSSAHRFLDQPSDIETEYIEYARTHLIQPDIQRFIDSLTGALENEDLNKSVPGYIVGPYGFGKTSTTGKVWYLLDQENNYITTPPIYFDELQSIVDAVYGWMRFRLRDREEHLEALEKRYQAKVTSNVEDIVDQTGFDDKDQTREEFEQLIDSGSIDIEFSVQHVLDFLSECNQIAKDAGYKGLVVIADELQQFISSHSSDKEAYSKLRDIAKSTALGLNEGNGLGLLFTMDDGLHGDLDVNADDVLARLAEQNVQLNLANVYNRDFPTKLWESLAETYGFKDRRYEVITEETLDAIGQICERGPPLSNGPRSVVDILTIAIEHYLSESEAFDALDLANAYYNGVVRFKGDHIKTAITEAINSDQINTPERENFIKLCGVFPRGVSDDLLKQYGVHEAKEQVKGELHGQLIITHEEGRTLKRLEREGEDRGIKDELFTQFYRDYDTTDVYDSNASETFRDFVVSKELFPAVRGKSLSSWVTEHEFEPETGGVHAAVFRGSFNGQEYPERLLEIRIGTDATAVKSPDEGTDTDLTIGFVANMDKQSEVTPHIERVSTDEVLLHLDLADSFDSLPSNIVMLEDYMSPEDVSPHLLLSLHHFMRNWEENQTVNPNQETQLEYIRDQLVTQSIQKAFGPPLNGDDFLDESGSSRRTVDPSKVVEKIFNRVIGGVYPDYRTLFISDNYKTFLDDYESLLVGNDPNIRISQKRGNTPIEGTKSDISNAIGVSSNSTAKTRLDKQFEDLVDTEVWQGNDAKIRLTLHPLEELLKDHIEDQEKETVSVGELYNVAAKKGYRQEEVDWAIRLLVGRDFIKHYQDEGTVELSDIAIDIDQVKSRLESLRSKATELNEITNEWSEYDSITAELDTIEEELSGTTNADIEILDDLNAELEKVDSQISTQIKATSATLHERARGTLDKLKELSSSSKPRDLKKTVEKSNVPFGLHIKDIETELSSNFTKATTKADSARSDLDTDLEITSRTATLSEIKDLQDSISDAREIAEQVDERLDDIKEDAADYADWCRLANDMDAARSDIVQYANTHPDNSAAISIKNELTDLMSEIQTEFQKGGDHDDFPQALRNAEMYRQQFEDLEDQFEEITQGDEENFNYRKNVLENTLKIGTSGHPSIRQNLSPNNAEKSRNDLKHEFRRQLVENSDGIEDVKSDIKSIETSIEYAELLNQVPDEADPTPADIRDQIADFESTIEDIHQAVSQMDITSAIQLPTEDGRSNSFPNTDEKLSLSIDNREVNVGERIDEIRDSIEALHQDVREWRQVTETPPEDLEYIMDELDYRDQSDLESVLIAVSEKKGDTDVAEFFADLETLFEGNHITLSIKSEHR